MKSSKAQSAMEYLMTYGWSILIIAVVIASLFSLNVFSSGAALGASCIGQVGSSCSAPVITQNGLLSFTLGQPLGSTAYSAYFACISSSNSISGGSATYFAFNTNGLVQTGGYSGGNLLIGQESTNPSNNIVGGTTLNIQGLQCYPATGGATGMLAPIGTKFVGTVWMAWSTTSSPWTVQYTKIITVSAKSSS